MSLTEPAGSTRQSIFYDAWGNERERIGISTNSLTFTGHEKDDETGLLYAKARFYDSDAGRFLTQDSWLGDIGQPPSVHRYSYALANPLVFVDPSGKSSQSLAELARQEKQRQEGAEPTRVVTDRNGFGSGRLTSFKPDAKSRAVDRGPQHPHSLEEQKKLARESQLAAANVRFILVDDPRQSRTVDEVLGLDTSPDAQIDAILRSRHRTLVTISRFGQAGEFVGENTLVIVAGTGDDVTVLVTGKDLNEEDASRWLAAAGVILPGISGSELRKGKKLVGAIDDHLDDAADVVRTSRTATRDTKKLANEAHSLLDPIAQSHKSTAVAEVVDINGNRRLILSSSDDIVPPVQRKWAKENGIDVVNRADEHAEESIINAVDEDLIYDEVLQLDAESPMGGLCVDCEEMLKSRTIDTDTPATGRKSRRRR